MFHSIRVSGVSLWVCVQGLHLFQKLASDAVLECVLAHSQQSRRFIIQSIAGKVFVALQLRRKGAVLVATTTIVLTLQCLSRLLAKAFSANAALAGAGLCTIAAT